MEYDGETIEGCNVDDDGGLLPSGVFKHIDTNEQVYESAKGIEDNKHVLHEKQAEATQEWLNRRCQKQTALLEASCGSRCDPVAQKHVIKDKD